MNIKCKKILSIMLSVVMLFSILPIVIGPQTDAAYEVTDSDTDHEDFFYRTAVSSTNGKVSGICIEKYLGSDVNVTVPEEIEGLPVIIIGEYAFSPYNRSDIPNNPDCANIRTITLPETIIDIKDSAFSGCRRLEKTNFSDALASVGQLAFADCVSLKEISCAKNPEGKFRRFGAVPFSGCDNLKELVLPESQYNYGISSSLLEESSVEKLIVKAESINCGENSLSYETLQEVVFDSYSVEFTNTFGHPVSPGYRVPKITFNKGFSKDLGTLLFNYKYQYMRDENGKSVFLFDEDNADYMISEYEDKGFKYFVSDGKAIILGFGNYGSYVNTVIPDTLGGYPVTEIFSYAFYNKGIKKLTLPDTLEYIGKSAFESYTSFKYITEVNFGKGLKGIDSAAFLNSDLTSVVLPDGVTVLSDSVFNGSSLESITAKGVVKIEDYAFNRCRLLEKAEFSDDLNFIGEYAFHENEKLTDIGVSGENVKELGKYAFYGSQLETFVLGKGLEIIPEYCFYDTFLKSLKIPDSVTHIGRYAFASCDYLTGTLTIPEKVEFLGQSAFGTVNTELYYNAVNAKCGEAPFGNCYIEKVVVGENVQTIPEALFKGCDCLREAIISDSVKEINIRAFQNCTALETVTIPEKLKALNATVFENCTSLKNVYYNAIDCVFEIDEEGEYISPFGCSKNLETLIIGNKVKQIPAYFAYGIKGIDEIVMPDSVLEIGKAAFKQSSVTKVTFSKKLVSIEESAFENTNVTFTALPENLRIIRKYAFSNCDKLTDVYIPNSVIHLEEGAFYRCDNLTKVRMSSNIRFIPDNAFRKCQNLMVFDWYADVKFIGEYAFAGDISLEMFDFTGLEKMYQSSFEDSGIIIVSLGENNDEEPTTLEIVEISSFENCNNLATLTIGGNITTIRSSAFANCSNLETVVISPNVTDIASNAFDGCEKLTIYCIEDSYAHEYALNNGIPVSTFVIDGIPNQVYTGKEIKPEVIVRVSDKKLTENTDFSLKYSDNINVGTAKVLVSGKGIYKVLASVANFTIITKDFAGVTVLPVENQVYTGKEITPEIVVKNGSQILKAGVDYTVTYKNNVEAGTAVAEITGKGNFSGKTKITFEIEEKTEPKPEDPKPLTFWEEVTVFFETLFDTIRNFFISLFN